MVNTKILVEHMERAGVTEVMLAEQLKMNPATLNNKINNEEGEIFTVKEANTIANVLSIPQEILTKIFFDENVAEKQQTGTMK
mgnify:CR=1 FL=1